MGDYKLVKNASLLETVDGSEFLATVKVFVEKDLEDDPGIQDQLQRLTAYE
jgi:hypothetical protein